MVLLYMNRRFILDPSGMRMTRAVLSAVPGDGSAGTLANFSFRRSAASASLLSFS